METLKNCHVLSVYYVPGTIHTLFLTLMITLQGETYLASFYR